MLKAPLQHGELLHKSRMTVFPHHTRANEFCQPAGHNRIDVLEDASTAPNSLRSLNFSQLAPGLIV
jgi:hypothetical protein